MGLETHRHQPGHPSAAIGKLLLVLDVSNLGSEKLRIALVSSSLLFGLVLLTGLLARHLGRRLGQPLDEVIESVRQIAAGDLHPRLAGTARGDLGDLERGIAQMASQLRKHHEEMQARIHEATAELNAQKQAAENAVAAKSRFLAAASHDLRQPLHALSLLVSVLAEKLPPEPPELQVMGGHINHAVQSMENLLNALLDLSRLESGTVRANPECTDLGALFERLELQFRVLAEGKGLKLNVFASRRHVRTDPLLLERVLANLLANAIRYTQSGGIVLGVRWQGDGQARIEVRDTGPGIPVELRARIFDEYFPLDKPERDASKGLGLGLAIVRRLCGLMDHPITVREAPGGGACFAVQLPTCPAVRCSTGLSPAEGSAPTARPFLLFIDDDASILASMRILLASWHCEHLCVDAIETALSALAEAGRPPSVIICDYRLRAGRTGIEAIEQIRARYPAGQPIPAALLTGDTARETLQAAQAAGLEVLQKPLRPAQLRSLIDHLLSQTR